MPSVAEFVQDEATTVIKLGKNKDIPVEIVYRPSQMTADRIDQMTRRDADGDSLAFLRLIEEVLVEWDIEGPLTADVLVTNDDGTPKLSDDGNEMFERQIIVKEGDLIPIDADVLKYMNSATIVGVWRELMQEQAGPDPRQSRGSRRR
jgi:hypothetical protein